MQSPPRDPAVDDIAPTAAILTGYDERHLVTYLRLLDADSDGADWQEPDRARRAWETHLARARWMTEKGYRHLLYGGAPH